ncbi:uncharacterized protein LOC135385077 [Ornithodoros turicata]|uniref:uncharacterized protein LOC135385077 n=1 Tax=Ornithodoros turicata TaxID=34597 RepID=UPI0031398FB5
MWCGDWRNLPQETLCLLRKSEECRTYLEEAQHYLYTLGNEEDENDMSRIVRVACLEPYLFGHSFFNKETETWARCSGIYHATIKVTESEFSREVREIVIVLDTLAYHISLLIQLTTATNMTQPISHLSEEQQDLLTLFDEQTSYAKAASLVKPSDIYSIFRKKLRVASLREEQVLGCFLIALKAALAQSSGSLGGMLSNILEEQRRNDKSGEDKLKNSGNQKFKDKKYKEAYDLYTDAIRKTRYSHLLYSNRAQCSLRLQRYQEAEMDARRTIILCPNFEKGYYKMVQVFDGQLQHTQALQVLDFYGRRCNILNQNFSHEMQDLQKRITENNGKSKNGKIENSSHSTPTKNKPKAVPSIPVPDLLSESDSDPEEKDIVVIPEPITKVEDSVMEAAQCREIIQKASEDLVDGLYKSALQGYKRVLSSKTDLPEFDLVFLKYAAGYTCLQMGSLEDLKEAIRVFSDATDNHKKVVFPLAYHGLAEAHIKMNRYAEALPYITKGLDIIDKGIFFNEAITWPGTKQKVAMRDKASLKKSLEELKGVCRAPPKPDAICRGEDCPMHRNIYYSDPDFKGFQQLHCHSKCVIQYHPSCWKDHRDDMNLTEKGFLGTVCPTPDCKDIIIEVETIEKDGTIGRHFVHSEYDKENIPRQKKTKKEKKQELRELKKKQRRDTNTGHPAEQKDDDLTSVVSAGCDSVGSNHDDVGASPTDLGKHEVVLKSESKATLRKESLTEETKPGAEDVKEGKNESPPVPPATDAPYVLKRDEEEDLPDVKSKKCKDKKKRNRGIHTLDIGPEVNLYSEYEERIARLAFQKNVVEEGPQWGTFCETQKERQVCFVYARTLPLLSRSAFCSWYCASCRHPFLPFTISFCRFPSLDPSRPFFIPEQLRDNEIALEAVLQHRGNYQNKEETREIRENIYEYLQDFLGSTGPLSINDPSLLNELENFPPEARALMESVGGLFNFLLQSMRFYTDGEMVHAYPRRSSYVSAETSPVDAVSAFSYDPPLRSVHTSGGLRDLPPLLDSTDDEYDSDSTDDDDDDTDYNEDTIQDEESQQVFETPASSNFNPRAEGFNLVPARTESSPSPPQPAPKMQTTPPPAATPSALPANVGRPPATFGGNAAPKEESKPKSKNAAVVVQNLLPTLSRRHLSDCVAAALNCLEKDVSAATLKEINEQLQSCQLVSNCVGKMDSAVQATLEATDYLRLQEESVMLKEQLDNALDANCKLQRKFTLDMGQTKEKLDEVTAELQESKESWKKTRLEMETEIKRLQQEKLKMKELKDELKSARSASGDPNAADNLDKVVAELTKERFEHQELQENFKVFQEAADTAVERAKVAEITVLRTALKWAKERHENAVTKARKTLQDLERIPILPGSDFRFTSEVARGKELADSFIREWATLYSKFERDINVHIGKLEDGAALADLPILDLPNKPEFNYVPPMLPPPPLLGNAPRFPGPLMPRPSDPIMSRPFAGNGLLPPPYLMPHLPIPSLVAQPASRCLPQTPASAFRPPPLPNQLNQPKTATSGPPPGLSDRPASSVRGRSPASSMDSMDDITVDTAASRPSKQPAGASNVPSQTTVPEPGLARASKVAGSVNGARAAESAVNGRSSVAGQSGFGASPARTPLNVDTTIDAKAQAKGERSERLLMRLQARFPNIPQDAILNYLKEVRTMKNGLSGMTITEIIDRVTEIIEKDQPRAPRTMSRLNREAVRGTLRPMRPHTEPAAASDAPGPSRRMWATAGKNDTLRNWDGKNSQCSICLEELDGTHKQVTNSCGHTFHEHCIQGWYKNDHTCPNCRAHSLPETDFPSLGK